MHKNQQDNQLEELKQLKKDFLSTFNSECGKRVLKHLESICFINRTTFPVNGQVEKIAYYEGMRMAVIHIKNMLNMDIEKLNRLLEKES